MSAFFYDCSQRLLKLDIFNSLLELANTLSSNDRVRFVFCHPMFSLFSTEDIFCRFLSVKLPLNVWVMLLLIV